MPHPAVELADDDGPGRGEQGQRAESAGRHSSEYLGGGERLANAMAWG